MMRSPKGLAVAVLRSNGEIVVRESPWRSYAERWPWLKWPFLRGAVVLIESLSNGITALQFSAQIAFDEENKAQTKPGTEGPAPAAPTAEAAGAAGPRVARHRP